MMLPKIEGMKMSNEDAVVSCIGARGLRVLIDRSADEYAASLNAA